jgi:hypothetical protein
MPEKHFVAGATAVELAHAFVIRAAMRDRAEHRPQGVLGKRRFCNPSCYAAHSAPCRYALSGPAQRLDAPSVEELPKEQMTI